MSQEGPFSGGIYLRRSLLAGQGLAFLVRDLMDAIGLAKPLHHRDI